MQVESLFYSFQVTLHLLSGRFDSQGIYTLNLSLCKNVICFIFFGPKIDYLQWRYKHNVQIFATKIVLYNYFFRCFRQQIKAKIDQ